MTNFQFFMQTQQFYEQRVIFILTPFIYITQALEKFSVGYQIWNTLHISGHVTKSKNSVPAATLTPIALCGT